MSARRINSKKLSSTRLANETAALRKAKDIIHIIYNTNQSTEKKHFDQQEDKLIKQIHHIGFILANFINCSCRGNGVSPEVIKALDSWNTLQPDFCKLLIQIDKNE